MTITCYACSAENPVDAAACAKCGALLEVNGYRISGVLGQGGYGAVYRAAAGPEAAARGAVQPGQPVALKQHFDPAGFHQLQREFAVLNRLRHPQLPRYYEAFEDAGHSYLYRTATSSRQTYG